MESFDLKECSYYKPIQTSVPGIQISEALPKLAPLMQHGAIIREHEHASRTTTRGRRTTRTPATGRSPAAAFPSIGAIVSKELGKPDFPLPNYAVIAGGNSSRVGAGTQSGYLGAEAPAAADLEAEARRREPEAGRRRCSSSTSAMDLLEQVESGFYKTFPARPGRGAPDHARGRGPDDAVEGGEGVRPVAGAGRHARQVRRPAATATAACWPAGWWRSASRSSRCQMPDWDNHTGYAFHKQNLPPLDTALSALITDLKDRGLLDTTLVVVMGEFGRGGPAGRPTRPTGTTAATGTRRGARRSSAAGSRAGRSSAGPTTIAATVEDRPVSIADFFATICTVIGVDYTKEYNEPGRPIRIVDKGEKLVTELL